jgi:vacuolar protein sorting-associated protein 13A/C
MWLFLLQLEIVSFNADDEDYEGYEFSITGKMSELRIVFLNRFIQEVHMPPSAVIPVLSVHKNRKKDFYRFCAAMLLIDQI